MQMHATGAAARVERAGLRLDVEELLVAGRHGHRVQPVEGALVDLAGDGDLALGLEAAHRLDRAGVVGAGDVAEDPGDLLEPRLGVAHLVALVAGLEDRRAGVEDVEHRVVRRRLRHRLQPRQLLRSSTPVPFRCALDLEALDGLLGRRVVDAGRHLGQPRQLVQPALQLAHLLALVAGPQHDGRQRGLGSGVAVSVGVEPSALGDVVGVSTGDRRAPTGVGRSAAPPRAGRSADVSSGPADGDECATARPTPYAVPAASRDRTALVTTTRRADMERASSGRANGDSAQGRPDASHLDVGETPIPGIWLRGAARF